MAEGDEACEAASALTRGGQQLRHHEIRGHPKYDQFLAAAEKELCTVIDDFQCFRYFAPVFDVIFDAASQELGARFPKKQAAEVRAEVRAHTERRVCHVVDHVLADDARICEDRNKRPESHRSIHS